MSFAPFVPSSIKVVRKMLEMAQVGPDDVVYDLGCGDGRILITAIREFGAKKAVGYELRNEIYKSALKEIEQKNLQDRVEIINNNLIEADLSKANVITLYLTTSGNKRLKPKLAREAHLGTRVVSHGFVIDGWHSYKRESLDYNRIYLYIIPDAYIFSLNNESKNTRRFPRLTNKKWSLY